MDSSGTASQKVIAGQTYPAQPLPDGYTPPTNPLDTAMIENDQLLTAQNQANNWNQNMATTYLNGTFQSWLYSYRGGFIPHTSTPPQPPNGFQVVPLAGNAGLGGFDFPQSGPPVCAVPPFTPIVPVDNTPKPIIPPGPYKVGAVIQDTLGLEDGQDITMPDGTQWQALSKPTPFGTVYLLKRIS